MITARVATSLPSDSRRSRLDPLVVKPVAALANTKLVPNSHACSKVRNARSSPLIPWGNPG
jgi:hypothetical protein